MAIKLLAHGAVLKIKVCSILKHCKWFLVLLNSFRTFVVIRILWMVQQVSSEDSQGSRAEIGNPL